MKRAVECAQRQTLRPTEIVVVDDGSTDHTPDVVRQLAEADASIKLVRREKSGGAHSARNLGVAESRGELLAFLDSDDLWADGKNAAQVALLERFPDAPGAFCGVLYSYVKRGVKVSRPGPATVSWEELICGNLVATSTMMVRRKHFDAVGGFDETLPNCEDWDLFVRLAKLGTLHGVQDDMMIYTYDDGDKLSRNYEKLLRGHEMVIAKILSSLPAGPQRDRVAAALELKLAEINIRIVGDRSQALKHFYRSALKKLSAKSLMRMMN